MMNYEEISNRAMILENLSEDLEDEEEGKRIVCMFCKRNNDSVCSKC